MRPSAPCREQLIHLLSEASELEHGLMCCYLFAGFSLRRGGEGLTDSEQSAVERWRASIRKVAVEEMLHLALVQNLLAAIGGAPHLQRPNFPVTAGLYPSGIVLELRRFEISTLDHFIFLERPEGSAIADGEGFEPVRDYERDPPVRRLTPSAEEYPSVSALYRAIEDGLDAMVAERGESEVFIGDPRAQVDATLLGLDGLHAVSDSRSARAAIERIIEQGEGSRNSHETSHFDRFRAIRAELQALRALRPDFDPAWPVARNVVMHRPVMPEARVHVRAIEAARILDLGNASYGLMTQLLARFFAGGDETEERKVLVEVAIELMAHVLAPIAELLARLPATARPEIGNAGLTFSLPRSMHALPRKRAAWALLTERTTELASACEADPAASEMGGAARTLRRCADRLAAKLTGIAG